MDYKEVKTEGQCALPNFNIKDLKMTELLKSGCQTCKKSVGKLFGVLMVSYVVFQWFIFFGSLAMLITLRINYDFFIYDIKTSWEGKCFNRLSAFLGVMYAVSTLGIIELFLYRDSIKKIASRSLSIRTCLKLIIEVLSVLYFVIDLIIVLGAKIFDGCGNGDSQNIQKAERIFIYAVGLYSANLVSFILYITMRRIILNDEKIKLYFDNFIKIKY